MFQHVQCDLLYHLLACAHHVTVMCMCMHMINFWKYCSIVLFIYFHIVHVINLFVAYIEHLFKPEHECEGLTLRMQQFVFWIFF